MYISMRTMQKWFVSFSCTFYHCKATYGRNTAAFQRTVTRETTTLIGLKSRLRTCFTFPDGTEDNHIDVSRDAAVVRNLTQRTTSCDNARSRDNQSRHCKFQ